MNYKDHKNCRVCGSDNLTMYLDLGNLPLTNNLCETSDEIAPTYPLQVMLCEVCGLSQLSIVVDPELLFGHYVYRSSISQGYKDHCRLMAKDLKKEYRLSEDSFMIDIAGNDGALLNEFKQEIGLKCLNVDPAKNLYEINQAQGVRMFTTFWGTPAAQHLIDTGWQKADLITATNVFAHVDDVRDFIKAAKMTLSESGVLIIEFPYLINFIENKEFDTVYFEHLSYFSIYPITLLCQSEGMEVLNVKKFDIHGGSVRVTIGHGIPDETVSEFVKAETEYRDIKPYIHFAENSYLTIGDFRGKIIALNGVVSAFAASAKGNVLLNCARITNNFLSYIVDQTPEKIGKYSPGTHIPIVSMNELINNPPNYLVILSWNFFDEIKQKCLNAGYKGKFILPIPTFTIID